jgi:hypothetical protein
VLITSLYICLIREGEDAIWHLLRVAAGLDSLIVGEGQILAQVKRCYERGIAEDGRGGKVVARMLNTAVTAGKRVRSETGISKGAVSISSAAAEFTQMTLNRDCGISGGIKVGLAPSRCSSAMSPSSSTFLSCSLSSGRQRGDHRRGEDVSPAPRAPADADEVDGKEHTLVEPLRNEFDVLVGDDDRGEIEIRIRCVHSLHYPAHW